MVKFSPSICRSLSLYPSGTELQNGIVSALLTIHERKISMLTHKLLLHAKYGWTGFLSRKPSVSFLSKIWIKHFKSVIHAIFLNNQPLSLKSSPYRGLPYCKDHIYSA